MRIHCTVRRSATRIHCTVRAINSQCAVRAVNIHVWSDSIASPFCNLFAWKIFPEWKHFVVSTNVPPPQLWGGQHTEMFVNHVTVFSQSVSHIRLSHTILYRYWLGWSSNITFRWTAKSQGIFSRSMLRWGKIQLSWHHQPIIFICPSQYLLYYMVKMNDLIFYKYFGITNPLYFICGSRYLLYYMVKMNDLIFYNYFGTTKPLYFICPSRYLLYYMVKMNDLIFYNYFGTTKPLYFICPSRYLLYMYYMVKMNDLIFYNYFGTTDTIFYSSWSISVTLHGQSEWFHQNLMVLYINYHKVCNRLGVCIQDKLVNKKTKKCWISIYSENYVKYFEPCKITVRPGRFPECCNRPYAYDVTEGRPRALGVKRSTATCVIAKHAARGATPACHTAGLARPGPRIERLSANAHCQHNTCALRDTSLASLLWRCDPLWRQCIRSIAFYTHLPVEPDLARISKVPEHAVLGIKNLPHDQHEEFLVGIEEQRWIKTNYSGTSL